MITHVTYAIMVQPNYKVHRYLSDCKPELHLSKYGLACDGILSQLQTHMATVAAAAVTAATQQLSESLVSV